KKKGFLIVPRLWSDPHYNVPEKIALLNGYPIVVFEGEEITGYPDDIALTAAALKKNNVRYGNIEIIKQDGDARLKALMGESVVRVHSVPRDELLKLNKEQTLDRFDRAVKERGIRMIYVRPFLPPQITEEPVSYNLNYVKEISQNILNSGYLLGTASAPSKLVPAGWQILLLGIGTIAVALLLLNAFVAVKWYWAWPFLVASLFVMLFVGAGSPGYPLEKGLALLAAIVFPAYAVVSNFGRKVPDNLHPLLFSLYIVANSVIDTVLGIFIIVGLLSNLDFMLTAQTFSGVKFALLIPVFLVAFYFFIKRSPDEHLGLRDIWGRVVETLDQNVKVFYVVMALAVLGALFVFVARSGNFSLPVPAAEKWFRTLLENSLTIRPRTKEFLVGYPFLFLSAYLLLKGKREWLWVTLSLGVIGLISLTNTFCHVHTPLSISVARSMNGMVLGAVVGFLLIWFINLLSRKKA
ncbi:MAG: hypothetical protein KKH83_01290, partial [Candidatus Margulisbacteria bacterium]|nr:hypothetical protein [Candidatus Margulisiibacteriota bacterium]